MRRRKVPTIRHLENSCSTDFFLFSVSTTVTDTGTDSAVDGYISTAAAVITLFPPSLPPSLSIVIYFQSLSHSLSLNIFQIVCLDDSLRATESEWRPLCLSVSLRWFTCTVVMARFVLWGGVLCFVFAAFAIICLARLGCCCRWRLITEKQAGRQVCCLLPLLFLLLLLCPSLILVPASQRKRENSVLNRN